MNNKKAFYINFALQRLVNCIATINLINLHLLDVSKKKTRLTAFAFSRFYDSFWLTDVDKFLKVVAHFEEITASSLVMHFFFQQSITSAVTFIIATTVATI